MSSPSDSTTDRPHPRSRSRCCGRGGSWSALNVVTMVAGFALFWPLGLCVLFWILGGRYVRELPHATIRQWSKLSGAWRGPVAGGSPGAGDNVVFNEYQQTQYERIREIKDEIRNRARNFSEFRARARRRADEEEFDRFMSDAPLREGS